MGKLADKKGAGKRAPVGSGVTGAKVIHNPPALSCEKKSISLPAIAAQIAKRRAKELGYRSESAYYAGLVIFDAYCKQSHWLTKELMNGSQELQDSVLNEVLRGLDNPEKPSAWIAHRIEEKAAQMNPTPLLDSELFKPRKQ